MVGKRAREWMRENNEAEQTLSPNSKLNERSLKGVKFTTKTIGHNIRVHITEIHNN